MVVIEQDPHARFERAIFNLLRSFNFIDLNIGLLISCVPEHRRNQDIYKILSNMTFNQKMGWFKSLLKIRSVMPASGRKGGVRIRRVVIAGSRS